MEAENDVAPEKVIQPRGVRYNVPILQHEQHDARQLELLLLAWTLLLYRHSRGEHIHFSWGLNEIGTTTNRTFEVNTSSLPWDAAGTVSTALEAVRNHLQQQLSESPLETSRYTLFFNDESAPSGSSCQANEEGDFPISWVSKRLLSST